MKLEDEIRLAEKQYHPFDTESENNKEDEVKTTEHKLFKDKFRFRRYEGFTYQNGGNK